MILRFLALTDGGAWALPDTEHAKPRFIQHIDLGLMDYEAALAVQLQLHERVRQGLASGFLLTVQHPSCLTLGKHADRKYLRESVENYERQGFRVIPTDRGGEVTAHEPGQLVVYPILSMQAWKLRPKAFVARLLQVVVCTLAAYGLESYPSDDYPGVWLGHRKICAIGVRLKNRVSYHGLALNVKNSLALFERIVPCGIEDQRRQVTSMQQELASGLVFSDVQKQFIADFEQEFGARVGKISIEQLLANA